VREKAEAILKLLANDARIEYERENARKIKEKRQTSAYSNENLPSHLSYSGYGSYSGGGGGGSNKNDSKLAIGLGAIEDFWEEGKKIVMNKFKGNSYAMDDKDYDEYKPEGGFDMGVMPEIEQNQRENGEWQKRDYKRNTNPYGGIEGSRYGNDHRNSDSNPYGGYEGSRNGNNNSNPYGGFEGSKYGKGDERQETWDRYAKEIFETHTEGFGGFKKTKEEILAENAKEVKKKWAQMETNFLEFETKPDVSAPQKSKSDFADFGAFGNSNEKQQYKKPQIFDDDREYRDLKQRPSNPVFEEFWDQNTTATRKQNSMPANFSSNKSNDPFAGVDWGTNNNSNKPTNSVTLTQTKSNPAPDWFNSNPFDTKTGAGGAGHGNLMDF